jgi:hypothetical protein
MDWILFGVYTVAIAVSIAAFGVTWDALRALNAGLASIGAIITVWLISDAIKGRIENYYESKFKPKTDK